jgi:hypothetical protein
MEAQTENRRQEVRPKQDGLSIKERIANIVYSWVQTLNKNKWLVASLLVGFFLAYKLKT